MATRPDGDGPDSRAPAGDRRASVLDSAIETFARHGYRRTSMDAVAESADITRPGLYFLFGSKEELFARAVTRMLTADLEQVEAILDDTSVPFRDRLVSAFGQWAGRYVGPAERRVTEVIESNPALAGPLSATAPERFAGLITAALTRHLSHADRADAVAQTLISASIGLKKQVESRADYLARMERSVALLVPARPSRRTAGS